MNWKPAAVALSISALGAASGCIVVKTGQGCEGGYCGVLYLKFAQTTPRPPKAPADVMLRRIDARVPAGAEIVGYFEWALNAFDLSSNQNCTEEIEGFFRGKAANLGFDGVVGVHQLVAKQMVSVSLTHEDGSITKQPISSHGAGSGGASGYCVGFPFVYKTSS